MPADPNQLLRQMQRWTAGLIRFLNEVGITPDIQQRIFETDHKRIYVLNEAEQIENGITIRAALGDREKPNPEPKNSSTNVVSAPAPVGPIKSITARHFLESWSSLIGQMWRPSTAQSRTSERVRSCALFLMARASWITSALA